MNTLQKYATIVSHWKNSPQREEMLTAKRYYEGFHDILKRQRMIIGVDGNLTPAKNIPNHKLIDNQYCKLVDQKTNYALGKPITIATSNEAYLEELQKIFDRRMFQKIRSVGEEAINGGIAWVYPYYNEIGEFKIKVFPSYEIFPLWTDSSHCYLHEAIRIYDDALIGENGALKNVNVVEIYTKNGMDRYIFNQQYLMPHPIEPHINYLKSEDMEYNWNRIPLIAFKYNAKEIPLIRRVKSLQDSLNQVLSDFQNNMEEDPRTTILVLKNYDGTDIPEFRQNLATYGVVKVHTVDGVQGGIDTLKVEVDANNYQAILMQLKRAMIENGRGFDAKEERMDGDPNQMNIESMYTDIDLDVNQMETEFQAGFEELKWFIDRHLILQGKGDFSNQKVEFLFNRDIFINENTIIENCVKSIGIISNKTIVAKHPWVADLQHEMKQIEEETQLELEKIDTLTAFEKIGDKKGSGVD